MRAGVVVLGSERAGGGTFDIDLGNTAAVEEVVVEGGGSGGARGTAIVGGGGATPADDFVQPTTTWWFLFLRAGCSQQSGHTFILVQKLRRLHVE